MKSKFVRACVSAAIFSASILVALGDPGGAGKTVVASAAAQDRSVPVYFNHAFTVLPDATHEAIRTSAWVAGQFADVEVRTTVRPDLTYTGLYLNFRQTYLEFFDHEFGAPVGYAGLALSDETPGGNDWVAGRWIAAFGADKVVTGTISRTVDGVVVPWFHFADVSAAFPGLFSSWNMEYVTPPGATTPPTRLEQRAGRYDPNKLAKDVVALRFALAPDDTATLTRELEAADWIIVNRAPGRLLALSPPDPTPSTRRAIVVEPATGPRQGITAIAISMNRPSHHTEPLGEAKLVTGVLGKKLAILSIHSQTPAPSDAAFATEVAPLVTD